MNDLATVELERLESLPALIAATDDIDDAVHRARTGIKRLRAYLRLARRSIGTNTYRTENAALRDTARLLAPARDAFVVIETARDLGADDATLAVLIAEHARIMDGFERTTRTDVLDRIGAIITRWQYVMQQSPGPKSIGSGLERTYRKGQIEFETARSAPTAVAFHRWRRRVKYLRYQLEALHAPEAVVMPFRTLGNDLGSEHDQTVLIELAEKRPRDPGFTAIAARSRRARDGYRSRAMDDGNEIFSHQPESFRHTIEAAVGLR